ncbi:hypothetical protein BB560_001704 [Smittium megazygosporum]|uniref:RNA helicase n=1 Tax=Smittium megazygosporum TaxID=133381 RepID=A0A2T9ZGV4_9FUNG|nr:hypothetical protein BB560_001704 [Smittium megazygosporum]
MKRKSRASKTESDSATSPGPILEESLKKEAKRSPEEKDLDLENKPDDPKNTEINSIDNKEFDPRDYFPPSEQLPSCSFEDLGLGSWISETLRAVEIKKPTQTQIACVPPVLKGTDVIGCAKTGSGKTAAFALPILQKLIQDPYGVFSLVLSPTRELAIQIGEQFSVFGQSINLKVAVIVGGLDMVDQAILLGKRPHVVIATPGRLADHIRSNSDVVNFKKIKFLVLDEADRLLTDTFAPDMSVILESLPKERQTLLFTATITSAVYQYYSRKKEAGNEPFVYVFQDEIKTVSTLNQSYLLVPSYVKDSYLVQLLLNPEYETTSVIIFTNKCKTAESINIMLRHLGFKSTALHSKMSQRDRLHSIDVFKCEKTKILVSTGVASRGLDIPSVDLVINFDIPRDPDEYIHRVGRTARIGRSGSAITIMTENDVQLILDIEKKIGKKLEEYTVSENKVVEILSKVVAARRVATMNLLDSSFGERDKIRKKKNKKALKMR